jgi:indole-3-glycerol phosphate synthase
VLRADYDPVAIARGYQAAGAAAFSVLTEPTFFDGASSTDRRSRGGERSRCCGKTSSVSEYQCSKRARPALMRSC